MSDSFRYPLDQANSRVFLPKLGWIRYRNSRDIPGTAKNITVSANSGKWFVSIQAEREIEPPVHPANDIVGILSAVGIAVPSGGEDVNVWLRNGRPT